LSKHEDEYWERRRAKDLEMIKNPDSWPQWPRLPIKRRTGEKRDKMELAMLLESQGQFYIGFGNIYAVMESREWRPVTPEQVIADGWIID